MRAPLLLSLLFAACQLPAQVRFKCEPDGTCAQAGHSCAADGYCYSGACAPRDTAAACAAVECGLVSDGCGNFTDCDKWCPEGFECGVSEANTCGVAKVCTKHGWCWENPLPQGATLHASWRADARHTWFVGEFGTVLRFDGEKSALEDVPVDTPVTFYGIHGTSRADVYVVGTDAVILHYDGATWTKEGVSNGVPGTLRAVLALPEGRAVAVGEGGRVVYREPSAAVDRRWRESMSNVTNPLVDLLALDDGGVVTVSTQGQLLQMRADQLTWTVLSSTRPSVGRVNAFAQRGGWYYVGGTQGSASLARLEADAGWTRVLADPREVFDLVVEGDQLWVVGQSTVRIIDAFDDAGTSLGQPVGTSGSPPTWVPWRTGVLLGPDEMMVAGGMGVMAVARPGAGQLLMRSQGSLRDVNDVCGYQPGAMFGASTTELPTSGCGGNCRPRLLERIEAPAGAYWRARDTMDLGGTTQLLACYALGPNLVWVMGNDSKFFSQSGANWTYGDFGGAVAGQYISGWGLPDAGYSFLRLGENSVTYSSDGRMNFVADYPPSASALNGVWGTSADDLLLVGTGGYATRWTGGQWQSPLTTGFTDDLNAVHGAALAQGGRRYVAGGAAGRVWSLEADDSQATQQLGTAPLLTGAWVSQSGAAWVSGYLDEMPPKAFVARQAAPGAPFVAAPLLADRELRGLTGLDLPDGGSAVWVSGPAGMILRRDGP